MRGKIQFLIIMSIAFLTGVLATALYANFAVGSELVQPLGGPNERASPSDWIKESQISVQKNRVVITIPNAQWARFTDTNSMDPIIDAGSNAIQVVPSSPDQIKVGDIVSYRSKHADGVIIHRVVYKGEDEDGIYFILKGDNNPASDPGKVRFEQILRVLVAVIY